MRSIDEKHKRMLLVPGSWFPVDKENARPLNLRVPVRPGAGRVRD
jgi:hypothetical protein